MPESRHSHRIAKLIGLVVVAALLAGCYQQPREPRQFVPGNDLHEQFTSEGQRVIAGSPHDEGFDTRLKLRERSHYTQVYDEAMIPAGRVYAGDDIEVRSRDGQTRRSVDFDKQSGVATLEDGWRVDWLEDGWAVSDPDGTPLGWWTDDDGLRLVIPGADTGWEVTEKDDALQVVDDAEQPVLEVRHDDFGAAKALGVAIDELHPLDGYVLGVWAQRHIDG